MALDPSQLGELSHQLCLACLCPAFFYEERGYLFIHEPLSLAVCYTLLHLTLTECTV